MTTTMDGDEYGKYGWSAAEQIGSVLLASEIRDRPSLVAAFLGGMKMKPKVEMEVAVCCGLSSPLQKNEDVSKVVSDQKKDIRKFGAHLAPF